jgi:hypothetical protein
MRKYLYHKQVERKRNFIGTIAALGASIGASLGIGAGAATAASFAAVGSTIGAGVGAVATAGAVAGAGIGAAKIAARKSSKGDSGNNNSPLPLPQAPTVDAAAAKAGAITTAKRKAIAANDSIYTSPLGIAGQAQVARKTLTGQ